MPYSRLKMLCLHWVTSPMSQHATAVKSMWAALMYYRKKSNYCKLILWHQHCVTVNYHSKAFVQTNCTHLWNSVLYHFINLLVNAEKVQNYSRFQSKAQTNWCQRTTSVVLQDASFSCAIIYFFRHFLLIYFGNACFLPFPFVSPPVEGAVVLFILSSAILFVDFFSCPQTKTCQPLWL